MIAARHESSRSDSASFGIPEPIEPDDQMRVESHRRMLLTNCYGHAVAVPAIGLVIVVDFGLYERPNDGDFLPRQSLVIHREGPYPAIAIALEIASLE
jgi:hypothetical protein